MKFAAKGATPSSASMALLGCLILGTGVAGSQLDVKNPEAVVLGEQWTLEWESVGKNKFDIALYDDDKCKGSQLADLCGKSDGCGDSVGDYNVLIPTSIGEGTYSVKLSLHDDPDSMGCSGGFAVSLSEPEGKKGSHLEAYAPEGEVTAGIEFTAEWDYKDGNGVTESRFSIDLYPEGCTGDLVATLCDKPRKGCKDSAGDYPVTIPVDTVAGTYSIKVSVFGASTPQGCSPGFAVASTTQGSTVTPDSMPTVETPWEGHLETKEACDSSVAIEVRYAQSTERIYFEHTDGTTGGCATLSQVLELRSEKDGTVKGPLYPIDPTTGEKLSNVNNVTGHWLVEADIYVTDGITLQLYGSEVGGDCDALRILSTDDKFFNLRGHGGSLDMKNTLVTSWDTAVNGVRQGGDYSSTADDKNPRSYISCISERQVSDLTCAGAAKKDMGECRMDIVDSEIAYLGYYASEAYGLTWKVRGFCKDKSNPELFDEVATRGDVLRSNIHHLFYGLYTYGHNGGLWNNNLMHENEWYGFDPHDDSDYLTIHNNVVWGNGKHGIIASKRCDHVSIQNNIVYGGGETAAGIFLHRSSDFAIVKGNYVYNMQDSGLATLESFGIEFSNNLIENCKYGIRLSLGAADNTISGNTFNNLSSYGFFTYVGSNEPDVEGGAYRPYNNNFIDNVLSTPVVCKIKEADDSSITGNTFNNAVLVTFDDSAGIEFSDNDFDSTLTTEEVINGACFTSSSVLGPVC